MRMRLAWKKSQETLYTSNRLYRNKTRSTGSVGKGLDSQLCHIGNCRIGNGQGCHSWAVLGGMKSIPSAPPTTGQLTVGIPQSKDSCFVWESFITDHIQAPPNRLLCQAGWGVSIITQILHGYSFTRPPSRSKVYFCLFRDLQIFANFFFYFKSNLLYVVLFTNCVYVLITNVAWNLNASMLPLIFQSTI